MKYDEKLVPTQIIGKDVDIVSEKNITVVGSNLLAENKLNIGAKEDINIISGKQGSSEVHQKTKTGFMKLSGRMSLEDNLKYENISSNVQAGKEVNLVSKKNINILASNISSKENINMLAKKNVNILAGDNVEENYKKETKYRTSLFADFKGLNFEVGAKVKGSQTKEGIHKTTVASSNINAGKDLYIKNGNDTTIQAANFISENTYVTSDGKINIISKDSTISTEFSNKEIEAKISAGVRLNGVKDTLKSSYQVAKGLKHLPDTIGIAKDLLKGQDLNEALVGKEKAIEEANLVANGPKTGEVGAGVEYGRKDKSWVNEQSSIIGKNSANITVEGKTNLIGSVIGGENTTLRTAELEYSDIHDKDKGYNFGINGNASFSKKRKWDENTQTTTERIAITKNGGLNYGVTDREQINRATIGAGTVIVGGETVNPNINRDESKAQIITRDIDTGNIKLEYKDNRRKWSDISNIMGEYGKSLGSDLDKMSGGKYDLENKLGQGASDIMFEIEKVLDHDLGNKFIGLIPTKEYGGGIAGQLQQFKTRYFDGTQKLYLTETEIMKDEKGHEMFDKDGTPLLSTKTRELKPGEIVGEDVRKVVTLNGVFNNKMEAIAGGLASTITADENKALLAGKTIKSVVIHNESGGLLVDATETLVTKFGGLLGNQNWGAKKLEKMFKDNPWIMEKMNWHSQGSIYGAAAMIHFLDTDEGKEIAKKNLGVIGIKGIAITALGYGKLDKRMKGLDTRAQLYYMRNIGDWVSSIAAQGMPINTNGHKHDNIGYNDDNYTWSKKSGIYERKTITVIRDGEEEEIAVPNYNYKIGEMDGKDMRSIFERWKDKRTQEKRYGGK